MPYLALTFVTAFFLTLLLIRSSGRHARLSADHDLLGPQKFHARPVPRVGGLAIAAAVLAGTAFAQWKGQPRAAELWLLILTAMPAFAAGVTEDLTKNVSPRRRLVATTISAALGVWLLDAVIRHSAIPGIDQLIMMTPFAIALTLLVVTGVANAINIIDGFNGLASMCVLLMLLAISYVAFQTQDAFVATAGLIAAGAVLGFFVWNFPAGLIFLGDGGAYFLGFLVAELSVVLIGRNAEVSPLFPLLLCGYPIWETIFTMYRRRVVRGVATGAPDGIHLHTLIHRRVIRWTNGATPERRQTNRNSMTSPYLWFLCLLSVIPAVLWWDSTPVLTGFIFLFMVSYVLLYWSIVRFKTPRWLVFRR